MQSEKAALFVRTYIDRCNRQYGCQNELTIVLYARLYYPWITSKAEMKEKLQEHSGNFNQSDLLEISAFRRSHGKWF